MTTPRKHSERTIYLNEGKISLIRENQIEAAVVSTNRKVFRSPFETDLKGISSDEYKVSEETRQNA